MALLNRGASLDYVDDTGLTALHYAVNSGQVNLLKISYVLRQITGHRVSVCLIGDKNIFYIYCQIANSKT